MPEPTPSGFKSPLPMEPLGRVERPRPSRVFQVVAPMAVLLLAAGGWVMTNGVPALIFAHDSRTTELAEFMQIPHVPVEQIDTIDLETLVSTADYDAFELRYRELYGRFAAFLSENGLPHRLRH